MNLGAWLQEQGDLTRWGFNEWSGRRRFNQQIRRERVRGAGSERVAELQAQQERSAASYQESAEVVRSDRLLRQARQKRIPIPAQNDAESWIAPVHGTQARLSPKAYDALRTRMRGDRYAFWALMFSLLSLVVAGLAYFKQH
jgi:hypothetical protein